MRWFLSAVRTGRGDGEGAERTVRFVCILTCVHGCGGGVLADTRPSGLSIIIIGVQAPRRIRSH